MFNSTPDLAHDFQMSQVMRYLKISGGKVELKETFLCFIKFDENGAEALTNLILTKLEEDHLDVQDMRDKGTTTQLPWPVSIMAYSAGFWMSTHSLPTSPVITTL